MRLLRLDTLSRPVRIALAVVAAAVAVGAAKGVLVLCSAQHLFRASTPLPVVTLGIIVGMTYGLLAVGLVLIYRSNGIINFAHGQIGAFVAVFFSIAVLEWHIPYWVAFGLALLFAGGTGAATEAGVVRRLRNAPRLMSIVATLGVGQFLLVFALVVNQQANAAQLFPEPSFLPSFNLGALHLTPSYTGMLILSPVVVVALALFLTRSSYGLAIRAAASNPERARLSGIPASRMSSLSWALAGGLSAFTAILMAPTEGLAGTASFGPSLLLRALSAAVLARMQSLPAAMAAGVGIGVVEQVLLWNYPQSSLVEVTLFVVVVGVLLFQRTKRGRDEDIAAWSSVQALRPVPSALRQLPGVRLAGPTVGALFVAVLAVLPLFITNAVSEDFTSIIGYAIVGLSVGLLSGLGGQLTLGQFAVAAMGAVVSYEVFHHTGDFPLALLYAGLAAAATSVLVGLPALRIRGLMLTVTTLAFALVVPDWLLGQSWLLGQGRDPGQPVLFGYRIRTGHGYYDLALVLFVLCLLVVRNVRRSGFARLLVATRDNEDNARAFSVRVSVVKLEGYLLAGFIAGIGGAAIGHSLPLLDPSTFPTTASISVVVMAVLGGVSVLAGPIVGAIFVLGLPMLNIGNIGLAATDFGALLFILWRPSGIVQLVEPVRDRYVQWVARHSPAATPPAPGAPGVTTSLPAPAAAATRHLAWVPPGTPLLSARGLKKNFGGVAAVRHVDLTVAAGETVGLIGPNGAGKTTTFEMLGGFTHPDAGRVEFMGEDVTSTSPEARARRGLIRSFQNAALFPTMTVEETVMVAFERVDPSHFPLSVVGRGPSERRKAARAREHLEAMGLGRYRDSQIRELSTGTRRITELACLTALEPVCLLLDEPSSGVAQRESEALGELLRSLKARLGLTLVIIEHDIPLIMSLADRIVAMADGSVIASGSPPVVQADPAVVEAYMGASALARNRSGSFVAEPAAAAAGGPS
ncbi:MAG TPA: ATP-binding cassette domain-containing protein [Acidimicrobiales bacterium]|nr:ATP-binding cassette domain-containing protein [Acidimicrobiales bacterium]